jgi:tellurite resistance protein
MRHSSLEGKGNQISDRVTTNKKSDDKRELTEQINIYEVLLDAICCVMCADKRATAKEQESIHEIFEKTKAPWERDEINYRIKAYVQNVRENSLATVIRETREKLTVFKRREEQEVLLRCLDDMTQADGVIDESEIRVCNFFKLVLANEDENRIKKEISIEDESTKDESGIENAGRCAEDSDKP